METTLQQTQVQVAELFLPYLWGMETLVNLGNMGLYLLSSYRTYEEWKPKDLPCSSL